MLDQFLDFIQTNLYFVFTISFLLFVIILQAGFHRKKLKNIKEEVLRRSKAVRDGQMLEQFAPYLEKFPCNPGDAKFLGKPVDFIAFKGLENSDEVEEILFIEVKTGTSRLSDREKSIRKAIENQKVRYVEYRLKS